MFNRIIFIDIRYVKDIIINRVSVTLAFTTFFILITLTLIINKFAIITRALILIIIITIISTIIITIITTITSFITIEIIYLSFILIFIVILNIIKPLIVLIELNITLL